MNENIELLKSLCGAFGPMGCEEEVAELIIKTLDEEKLCDRVVTDINGNVFAYLYRDEAAAKKASDEAALLICAHTDEVGFMVTSIDGDGYVRFGCVGGIDPRVLCSRRVVVGNENKESRLEGVICSKPIHLMGDGERTSPTPVDKMYIDIGAKNKEEAEKLVSPGDFGTFAENFSLTCPDGMKNGRIVSKAIDDRVGCAVMLAVLRRLRTEGRRPTCDMCMAFTVGEEGGIKGAAMAAHRTRPFRSIILESTTAGDIADAPETERVVELGKGGALSIMDNGTIYDRPYVEELMKLAADRGIACQYKRYVAGGNDAANVQRSAIAVSVAALSCPTRYLHTAMTVADAADFESMIDLVAAAV